MAEVLGVVASGISVASFAIQLADSIKKLEEFVDDVRDAPDDIKYTIHELDTLNLQLADIEKELQQNPASTINNTSLQQCLSLCQKGTTALDSIVKDLEAEMKIGKRRTSVKTWFKKGILEKYDKRLERAKSSLMLSYLIYTKHVQTKLIIEVRQAVLTPPATAGTVDTTVQQDMTGRSPKNTCSSKQPQAKKRYHLNLPTWLIAKAWNITLIRSVAGWDMHFRYYAVIPANSPIFIACRERDLETIKILFNSGQASPFCTDAYGWTPLHYVTASHWLKSGGNADDQTQSIFQCCQYLLDQGADPSTISVYGCTPLEYFYRSQRDDPDHSLLVQNLLKDSFDPGMEYSDHKYMDLARYWPPHAINLLRKQSWPPYQDIPLLQRLEYALKPLSSFDPRGIGDFETALGSKFSQHAVLDIAFANDAMLRFLPTIMQVYGTTTYKEGRRDNSLPDLSCDSRDWSEVLVGAINRNVDLQDCQGRGSAFGCRTAMTNFVQGWIEADNGTVWNCKNPPIFSKGIIGKAVYTWFHTLDDLDIDLDAFAHRESQTLKSHAAHDPRSSYLRCRRDWENPQLSWVVKLHGMEKSSQSGHWELCFEWPPIRLYQLLGRPRSSSGVPGAWGSWNLTDEKPDTWERALGTEE